MKNKKVIYAVAFLIVIIGIIVIATLKLNFSLEYSDHKRLDIYLEKDFNNEEIKAMAKEVFPNQELMVQKIEVFGDSVAITVKEASDEQVESLVQKINEKYGLEIKKEEVGINQIPHTRGRDLVQRYVFPLVVATILTAIYLAIRYVKIGGIQTAIQTIGIIALVEALYLSAIAITRLPITKYTIPLGIAFATITTIILLSKYEVKLKAITEKARQEE